VKGHPDELAIEAGEYVFDSARAFRLRLSAFITGLNKKKGKNAPVEKPTHGYIWYAKKYPTWQATILDHLTKESKSGSLPDNKKLAADLAKIPDLKKYQKKVMPFVQAIKERVEKLGLQRGLAQGLEFNEAEILDLNIVYLCNNLDVRI
jgi:leucyl-tRNA synthetase